MTKHLDKRAEEKEGLKMGDAAKGYEDAIQALETARKVIISLSSQLSVMKAFATEHYMDNLWNAFSSGLIRPEDNLWVTGGMSDAEWLCRELGVSPKGAYDPEVLKAKIEAATIPETAKCIKCGGDMRPGIAMGQTLTGIGDFHYADSTSTLSPGGPGKVIECEKCIECGFSVKME